MSSAERREQILIAATKAFSSKSYEAVSLRDIAKKADVNHAIIRYHFGSKADLWNAVFQDALGKLVALRISNPIELDTENPIVHFREYTRLRVAHLARNPFLIRMFHMEIITNSERFAIIDLGFKTFYKQSLKIFRQFQEMGIARHINLKDILYILPGLMGGRFLYPNYLEDMEGNSLDIEEVIDAHTDLIVALVVGTSQTNMKVRHESILKN